MQARKGYASPRARTLSSRERERAERERIARTKGADQTSTELRAMLDSPIQQGGVGLDVQAAAFKGPARNASVALAIEVDGSRLQFAPPKDNGVFANVVELSLYGINAQGKALQGLRAALDLTLRPDTYERVKKYGLRANPRIELPPGRYQLRIGVRESGAGEMGTVFYDLDVPDFGARAFDDERIAAEGSVGSGRLHGPARRRCQQAPSRRGDKPAQIYDIGRAFSSRRNLRNGRARSCRGSTSRPRLIAEAGKEVSVVRDELSGGAAGGRDKSATYRFSKSMPLRDVPPGAYLLRVEAQRRGDTDKTVVRETQITVASE